MRVMWRGAGRAASWALAWACAVGVGAAWGDAPAAALPERIAAQDLAAWLEGSLSRQGVSAEVEAQGAWPHGQGARVAGQPVVTQQVREGGLWRVQVELQDEGGQPLLSTRFLARERQPVWVLSTLVRKGEPLRCEQVRAEQRVWHQRLLAWQGACAALAEQVMRRTLQAGEVLTVADVGPPHAVREQQQAVVWSRVNGIAVQASGQVLADAQVGQRVPVRLTGQTQVIQALVMAPGQLQVTEERR